MRFSGNICIKRKLYTKINTPLAEPVTVQHSPCKLVERATAMKLSPLSDTKGFLYVSSTRHFIKVEFRRKYISGYSNKILEMYQIVRV
jgi:hypothetical protein